LAINGPLTNQGPVTFSLSRKLAKLKEENTAEMKVLAMRKLAQVKVRMVSRKIWNNLSNCSSNCTFGAVNLYLEQYQGGKVLVPYSLLLA